MAKKIKWLSEQKAKNLLEVCESNNEIGRSVFLRDYGQVIYSTFFRRLAHKTQVHAIPNSDHIRTRLTHSIEVEQIGRHIARYFFRKLLNNNYFKSESSKYVLDLAQKIEDLTATACLAHDVGHAPFGHTGAVVLNKRLNEYEFDDNKQVTRILLNELLYENLSPSAALVCSVLKKRITIENCYAEEKEMLLKIVKNCGLENLRHPVSFFMEAADDIAYITSDLSDYILFIARNNDVAAVMDAKLFEKIHLINSAGNQIKGKKLKNKFDEFVKDRRPEKVQEFCSHLLRALLQNSFSCIDAIISSYKEDSLHDFPQHMNEFMEKNCFYSEKDSKADYNLIYWKDNEGLGELFHAFKKTSYKKTLLTHEGIGIRDLTAQRVLADIIEELSCLTLSKGFKDKPIFQLLTDEFKDLLSKSHERIIPETPSRIILDFVSGMTDRYALDFWEKIRTPNQISKFVA